MQKDLYFTSNSSLSTTMRQDSVTKPEGKAAKILGKSAEGIHIYKINSEVLLGFLPSPNRSPKNSERDEETLSQSSDIETETDGYSDDVLSKSSASPVPKLSIKSRRQQLRKQMIVIPDAIDNTRNGIIFPEPVYNDFFSFCSSPDSGVNVDYTTMSPPSILDNHKMDDIQLLKVSSLPSLLDHTTHPPLSIS